MTSGARLPSLLLSAALSLCCSSCRRIASYSITVIDQCGDAVADARILFDDMELATDSSGCARIAPESTNTNVAVFTSDDVVSISAGDLYLNPEIRVIRNCRAWLRLVDASSATTVRGAARVIPVTAKGAWSSYSIVSLAIDNYRDGWCEVSLPRGTVVGLVSAGPDHHPAMFQETIQAGARLTVNLWSSISVTTVHVDDDVREIELILSPHGATLESHVFMFHWGDAFAPDAGFAQYPRDWLITAGRADASNGVAKLPWCGMVSAGSWRTWHGEPGSLVDHVTTIAAPVVLDAREPRVVRRD